MAIAEVDLLSGTPTIGQAARARERVERRSELTALSSSLGQPLPLFYGKHILAGLPIFEHGVSGTDARLFLALGEGEWDGIEKLWINGEVVDATDTSLFHFHPGLDGERGVETSPGTRNQKVCSLIPAGWPTPFTWSRTAYLGLKLKDDPTAPNSDFHILGIYRTLRARDFDNSGAQTAYGYSPNPARVFVDVLLRRWLKPYGKINEALTAAEKLKVNWPAWTAWRDACDVGLADGKRWEAHIRVDQQESLLDTLGRIAMLGRAYMLHFNGQVALYHDEARAPILTIGVDDIVDGSLTLPEKDLRALPTRFAMHFLNLGSGRARGTIATTGTAVSGTGTLFTQELRADEPIELLDGAQAGEVRKILSITDDVTATLASAFSANQSGRLFGRPNADFQEQTKQFIEETREDQTGRVIDAQQAIEVGNATGERVERLGEYTRRRNAREKQVGLRIVNTRAGALDLLPGDEITAPDAFDYQSTAEFEIEELAIFPDLSVEIAAEKQDDSIFVDAAGPQQPLAPSLPANHYPLSGVAQKRASEVVLDPGSGELGLVKAARMHRSAYRAAATTDRTGSNSTASFVTVASWSIKIPKGSSVYQGALASIGGAASQPEVRLKIGALTSNVLSGAGTLTVSGVAGGATVTVELQARSVAADGACIPHFDQVQDTDQAETHFP